MFVKASHLLVSSIVVWGTHINFVPVFLGHLLPMLRRNWRDMEMKIRFCLVFVCWNYVYREMVLVWCAGKDGMVVNSMHIPLVSDTVAFCLYEPSLASKLLAFIKEPAPAGHFEFFQTWKTETILYIISDRNIKIFLSYNLRLPASNLLNN